MTWRRERGRAMTTRGRVRGSVWGVAIQMAALRAVGSRQRRGEPRQTEACRPAPARAHSVQRAMSSSSSSGAGAAARGARARRGATERSERCRQGAPAWWSLLRAESPLCVLSCGRVCGKRAAQSRAPAGNSRRQRLGTGAGRRSSRGVASACCCCAPGSASSSSSRVRTRPPRNTAPPPCVARGARRAARQVGYAAALVSHSRPRRAKVARGGTFGGGLARARRAGADIPRVPHLHGAACERHGPRGGDVAARSSEHRGSARGDVALHADAAKRTEIGQVEVCQ